MTEALRNQFQPDYVSPPGETLRETLQMLGMSQAELSKRSGRSKKTINEIINGKAPITAETALQLERVLGVPARFWLNREQDYQEAVARELEEVRFHNERGLLDKVPYKAMIRKGWISSFRDQAEQLQEVLRFFGVASPRQCRDYWGRLEPAFRRSPAFQGDPGALFAWLRQGEIQARQIECGPYDRRQFSEALRRVRGLTVEPVDVFEPEMVRLCAEAGVAVVFVPELPRTHVSGATRWLTPHKALIQLSLRYKKDDHFWFSFFHEAGHILLHPKKLRIKVGEHGEAEKDEEDQADRFAADRLIPPKEYNRFLATAQISKTAIRDFASKIGLAPGIVVGRLQHDHHLLFKHCNDLKRTFQLVSTEQG